MAQSIKLGSDTYLDFSGVAFPRNAGAHNLLYRGKSLGTSVTAAQYAQIAAGTFDDLFLGDYWTLSGRVYRIWGFDWYLNKGDQGSGCTTHHIVVLPDANLLTADGSTTHYMNDTNTTEGGYKATKLRTTYLSQCLSIVQSAFGSAHILSHRELISNAVTNGKASGWEWVTTSIEIPSEVMMYGSAVWSNYTDGGAGYNVGSAYPALPLALVAPQYVVNRASYWLRDVVSASWFAYVHTNGSADYYVASHAWVGVRPFFLVS